MMQDIEVASSAAPRMPGMETNTPVTSEYDKYLLNAHESWGIVDDAEDEASHLRVHCPYHSEAWSSAVQEGSRGWEICRVTLPLSLLGAI